MDVDEKRIIEGIQNLVRELKAALKKVRFLEEENARLRDENAKLLIDVAFFDGRLPSSKKGT